MLAEARQFVFLPDGTPLSGVIALLLVAGAARAGLHWIRARAASGKLRAALFLLRVVAGGAVLLAAARLLTGWVLLTTNWRLWPLALGGSAAVEALVSLYRMERRSVSRRAGMTLVGLRVALILAVIAMLAQPVFSWELVDEVRRYVAVLIDGSASMDVRDPQRPPGEKLRLAETLGVPSARRRVRFERVGRQLEALRLKLLAMGEDLASLDGADTQALQKQLARRRNALTEDLNAARKTVEEHLAAFDAAKAGTVKLDKATSTHLAAARAQLAVGIRDRLAKLSAILDPDNASRLAGDYDLLLGETRGVAAALGKLREKIDELAKTYDALVYAALSDEQRRRIDDAVGRTRLELARDVLVSATVADDRPLLDALADGYRVKLYKFAEDCVEGDPRRLRRSAAAATAPATAPAASPATAPAATPVEVTTRPVGRQGTDLAGALDRVAREMSGKRLAGVVMLLDGRHNAARRVDPVAAQLGLQKVPLCSVVMAPDAPPRDAAVVSVHAAQTVTEKDEFLVDAGLKLDGLAGEKVQVALFDARRRVSARTVHVPPDAPSYRHRVQFSDEPEGPGLHTYSVRIEPVEGEVFSANNEYPLTVSVTKEQVALLVIEGRPRWEFRYVKNIFADRDRNVRLQYVLLEPDRIAGQPERKTVHASASRRRGLVEATALPAGPQEWMKFDVVMLGDVDPNTFDGEQLESVRRFVTERGGTLIVVAGPRFMPHAYAGTPLEEVLPAVFEPDLQPVEGKVKTGFDLALTAAGRVHTVMFQKVEPQENIEVWDSLPAVYWRHPTLRAKEGATVLAFAMPPSPPDFLRPPDPAKGGDEDPRAARRREAKRRQFQRSHALVTLSKVAAGRVMVLSTDRTWRLRYRVGDTYHHRFWGQVMRWATADKLRAGTDFVKLGTDRARYGPDGEVRVRAKIVRTDLSPVVSEDVAVKVYAGDKLLLRRPLEYQPGSQGIYEAKVAGLDSGTYRVELQAPEAEPILAADKVKKVTCEFSVDPVGSAEEVELSADRGLLRRLANLTGGTVLEPYQAGEVTELLGPQTLVRRQRRELRLWDSWPLLVVVLALAATEWLLRKRVGLA